MDSCFNLKSTDEVCNTDFIYTIGAHFMTERGDICCLCFFPQPLKFAFCAMIIRHFCMDLTLINKLFKLKKCVSLN